MPHFLKRPFSCAITIGEQSVSAIMPNFIEGVSGESSAYTLPTQPRGRPPRSEAIPALRTAETRKFLRFIGELFLVNVSAIVFVFRMGASGERVFVGDRLRSEEARGLVINIGPEQLPGG